MTNLSKETPVLILGASGFLGSSLTDYLSGAEYNTITPSLEECNLLDVRSVSDYFSSLNKPVQIVFCAGILPNIEDSFRVMIQNMDMVHFMGEVIPQDSVSSIIFLSSADVYGFPQEKITERTPTSPRGYYGLSKFSSEVMLNIMPAFTMPVTILRLPGIYGPGNNEKSIVSFFFNQLISGKEISIRGDGSALRDYVHVKDVCHVIDHFLGLPYQGIVNVATGRSISIKELVAALADALQVSPEICFIKSEDTAFAGHLVFDTTHLQTHLLKFKFKDVYQGMKEYANKARRTSTV